MNPDTVCRPPIHASAISLDMRRGAGQSPTHDIVLFHILVDRFLHDSDRFLPLSACYQDLASRTYIEEVGVRHDA